MIAVDTNVLVYAAQTNAGQKHKLAVDLLAVLFRRQICLLPLQVLAEFHHVSRRKLAMPATLTARYVSHWTSVATVESYGKADFDEAQRAHEAHGLSIWDALVWATCDRCGVEVLATEDLQDGRRLGAVSFLDPFNPANAGRLGLV